MVSGSKIMLSAKEQFNFFLSNLANFISHPQRLCYIKYSLLLCWIEMLFLCDPDSQEKCFLSYCDLTLAKGLFMCPIGFRTLLCLYCEIFILRRILDFGIYHFCMFTHVHLCFIFNPINVRFHVFIGSCHWIPVTNHWIMGVIIFMWCYISFSQKFCWIFFILIFIGDIVMKFYLFIFVITSSGVGVSLMPIS